MIVSTTPRSATIESSALPWRTSSYSGGGGGACVQVAALPAAAGRAAPHAVRDSKNPADGLLAFAPGAWSLFLDAVRDDLLPTT
ncbi:MAG: DUF397 domain-containing protein [Frankia sp.]